MLFCKSILSRNAGLGLRTRNLRPINSSNNIFSSELVGLQNTKKLYSSQYLYLNSHHHSVANTIDRNNISSVKLWKRSMSSTSDGEDLASILTREIEDEESSGNDSMPEELVELKTEIEAQWRIVNQSDSEPGSMIVKMFRKEAGVGGAKISVEFNCQDREEDEVDDAVVSEDEENVEELASGIRFDAIITRAGRSLIFSCVTLGTEIQVEEVCIRAAASDTSIKTDDTELYGGPTLDELEVDLQESLPAFVVNECGLDDNFAAFLSMYADYKEQMEYVQWLKGVRSFVQ